MAASDEDVWRRFNEAVEVLREAQRKQQAPPPGEDVLVALEALAAPFRGEVYIIIENHSGKILYELNFDVRRTVREMHEEIAALAELSVDCLGLMMSTGQMLSKDEQLVMSYGIRAGVPMHLVLLVGGVPQPDHAWEFRDIDGDVTDSHGDLVACLCGVTCSQSGIIFDGQEAYVEIAPWEWSGPVTIEIKAFYNSYAHQAVLFALGKEDENGRVCDLYCIMSYMMFVVRESLTKFSRVMADDVVTLGKWFHLVATCEDGSTVLYIDGHQAGRISEGANARPVYRKAFLGRSIAGGNFFDGTIAFFRTWHGVALPPETVHQLYLHSCHEKLS
mmetsp:Transcript_13970/g.26080  ORF Transcript_13970/g.26080 Transcript_13970/m.26080 type:complete len:332 (+) Transcript_13970:91-1086(+)